MDKKKCLSVIVCSKDRRDLLNIAINSIKENIPKAFHIEIVIVEENDMPKPIPGTKYIFLPRKNLGLGYARNVGVKAASGEYYVFTDDDVIVDKNWIENLIEPMEKDSEIYGVSGATLIKDKPIIGTCEAVFGVPGGGYKRLVKSKNMVSKIDTASGCNMAYRACVFKIFNFDTKDIGMLGADDTLLSSQVAIRWGLVFTPFAIVYHKPRNSIKKVMKLFKRRRYVCLSLIDGRIEKMKTILHYRSGIWLRAIVALIICATGVSGLLIVLVLTVFYYGITPIRYCRELVEAKAKTITWIFFPLFKMLIDISVGWVDLRTMIYDMWVGGGDKHRKRIINYYLR